MGFDRVWPELVYDALSSLEKEEIPDQTASSCGLVSSGRTQGLSYMICSCREPEGSTSMGAALAWLVYLT
jgi:hypothetical protein